MHSMKPCPLVCFPRCTATKKDACRAMLLSSRTTVITDDLECSVVSIYLSADEVVFHSSLLAKWLHLLSITSILCGRYSAKT